MPTNCTKMLTFMCEIFILSRLLNFVPNKTNLKFNLCKLIFTQLYAMVTYDLPTVYFNAINLEHTVFSSHLTRN
eukprot:c20118_g1_i1 orf=272-493(+)